MFEGRLCLDGHWEFLAVADEQAPRPIEVRPIVVPGPWQAQFDDLRMRAGTAIYRRKFVLPEGWLGRPTRIRFGAVFHAAKVWVNGTLAGQNEGGFLPFSFDVSGLVRAGENEVTVRVDSPTDNPIEYPDAPFAEIPFGKQSWYGPLSGIWQSVHLELRIPDHIDRLRILPERRTGTVVADASFLEPLREASTLSWTIRGPDGGAVAEGAVDIEPGTTSRRLVRSVGAPLEWSPETPNLYRLDTALLRDGLEVDRFGSNFGFRDFETRDGRFLLNDRPIHLRAALDQDYHPDMISTPPSLEAIEDQFRKAKALGLNALRCHIKAPDPRYYDAADRIGLLIWTELPNGGMSTERSRARKHALMKGIVDRDGNHPSIVIWTIINENWGVDLVHDADHRAWLREMFAWLKRYDPGRLVVDNSPLAPSFHVETDIADYHYYAAFPDHRRDWDHFVDGLAKRASWLYSPAGDAEMTGKEPLMCSEFGNWGLPNPRDLRDAEGREPWWFETGHDWGEGVMYAHGIENRFTDWSLDRVFPTLEAFTRATQWQQFRALKYEIEAMRRKPELAGYVITEFTDCHWECNGLLDMRRNPRVFADRLPDINAARVVVPKWDRLAYWSGERAEFQLDFADGSLAGLPDGSLEVTLGAETRTMAVDLPPAAVAPIGRIAVTMPAVSAARVATVGFVLRDGEGRIVARNSLDCAVHPPFEWRRLPEARLWSPDEDILGRLETLGYRIARIADDARLVVARRHDEEIAARVRAGGHLLLLPEEDCSLYPFFPHWQAVSVVSRDGTPWRGDWASSFAWLKRGGPFGTIPGGPLLDETMDRVLPRFVVNGVNRLDFQARVHAGIVVGWIHKAAALIVEKPYGRGRMVASTLRPFQDPPLADPAATALADALIALALKPAAAPEA